MHTVIKYERNLKLYYLKKIFEQFAKFYVHVTVHPNKFLYNKINQMHQFPKFTPV